MKSVLLFTLIITLLAGASCKHSDKNTLTILKVTEHGSAKISDKAIIKVLEQQTKLKVNIIYDLEEEVALEKLQNKTIDMAIIPSNTTIRDVGLSTRTVMPLLPRILMVIVSPGIQASGLKELMENNPVLYEDMSRMDSIFFEKLFVSFNINLSKVRGEQISASSLKDQSNSSAVYIGLTHLHNPFVLQLLDKGWSPFALDKITDYKRGSSAEGFQMAFPWAYPFILPKSFYRGKPDEPVLTVAIQDVLVCLDDFDPEIVFLVTQALIENKANLVRQNNIYSLLQTELDTRNLPFPLQKGTLHYLNRDKPSIWFRYANLIWPILSVIAILLGALASFHKHLKKQLKDRIDTYYGELLNIRSQVFTDQGNKEKLMEEMLSVRSKAFNALKNNKLVADESFNIFLRLYQEITEEVQKKSREADG